MTRISPIGLGRLLVQGITVDDGPVRSVRVNGCAARPLTANFLDWQVEFDAGVTAGSLTVSARAEDSAGNSEPVPHLATIVLP
jgi:hypothetical protein